MQRFKVSGAVRPIYGSLGVKRLIEYGTVFPFIYTRPSFDAHFLMFFS